MYCTVPGDFIYFYFQPIFIENYIFCTLVQLWITSQQIIVQVKQFHSVQSFHGFSMNNWDLLRLDFRNGSLYMPFYVCRNTMLRYRLISNFCTIGETYFNQVRLCLILQFGYASLSLVLKPLKTVLLPFFLPFFVLYP